MRVISEVLDAIGHVAAAAMPPAVILVPVPRNVGSAFEQLDVERRSKSRNSRVCRRECAIGVSRRFQACEETREGGRVRCRHKSSRVDGIIALCPTRGARAPGRARHRPSPPPRAVVGIRSSAAARSGWGAFGGFGIRPLHAPTFAQPGSASRGRERRRQRRRRCMPAARHVWEGSAGSAVEQSRRTNVAKGASMRAQACAG